MTRSLLTKTSTRKQFLATLALLATGLATPAFAQGDYPNKPIKLVVPFSPGGATDIVTRIVAQKLSDVWGQQVLVDNRAGASGNIGGELAAKAPPDGYTVFMTSGSIVAANQHLFRKMSFSPEKDLAAVTNVAITEASSAPTRRTVSSTSSGVLNIR